MSSTISAAFNVDGKAFSAVFSSFSAVFGAETAFGALDAALGGLEPVFFAFFGDFTAFSGFAAGFLLLAAVLDAFLAADFATGFAAALDGLFARLFGVDFDGMMTKKLPDVLYLYRDFTHYEPVCNLSRGENMFFNCFFMYSEMQEFRIRKSPRLDPDADNDPDAEQRSPAAKASALFPVAPSHRLPYPVVQ